jgi:hypothetical protein
MAHVRTRTATGSVAGIDEPSTGEGPRT